MGTDENRPNTTPGGADGDGGSTPDWAGERAYDVRGELRGVGYRPFVARLAASLGLSGAVWETDRGVRIVAIGYTDVLEAFERRLLREAPAAATVEAVEPFHGRVPRCSDVGFHILARRSTDTTPNEVLVSLEPAPHAEEAEPPAFSEAAVELVEGAVSRLHTELGAVRT